MSELGLAEQFAAVFAGLTRAKGRYVVTSDPSKAVVGEKAKGKATTVSETVTIDDYLQHLGGMVGLGIIPVRDDGTCVFGAIDIDQYTGLDHASIVTRALALKVPVSVCRSKSGGAHVYVFAAEPGIQATVLIEYLKKLRSALGVDARKAREIFPKQKTQSGGIGNWINLPYFGTTPRKAIRADGTEIPLEEFLSTLQRLDLKDLTTSTVTEDLIVPKELPPCLEHLVAEGIPPGMRNEALFNFTVFAVKKNQLDRKKVYALTQALNVRACVPPLLASELNTTIDSVLRHEYNYKCTMSPIVEVCNKDACAMRPYGPQASNRPHNLPEIEKIEIRGDEEGETVFSVKLANFPKFVPCTSRVMMEYEAFKRAVLDTCHVMLPVCKQKDWDAYITARFAALSASMRAAPERTKRGLLLAAIDDWIAQSASTDPKFFAIGRPFLDEGSLYVSFAELCARLRIVQSNIPYSQVARVLEDSGWEKTAKTIAGRKHENVWTKRTDGGTTLPDAKTDVLTEVDGHIVMDVPKDLPASLVDELTWEQFKHHEEGPET